MSAKRTTCDEIPAEVWMTDLREIESSTAAATNVEGLTRTEMAEACGCSWGTTKNIMRFAEWAEVGQKRVCRSDGKLYATTVYAPKRDEGKAHREQLRVDYERYMAAAAGRRIRGAESAATRNAAAAHRSFRKAAWTYWNVQGKEDLTRKEIATALGYSNSTGLHRRIHRLVDEESWEITGARKTTNGLRGSYAQTYAPTKAEQAYWKKQEKKNRPVAKGKKCRKST